VHSEEGLRTNRIKGKKPTNGTYPPPDVRKVEAKIGPSS